MVYTVHVCTVCVQGGPSVWCTLYMSVQFVCREDLVRSLEDEVGLVSVKVDNGTQYLHLGKEHIYRYYIL